jgi:RNA polymerase sigma factor (sigma-70 family)
MLRREITYSELESAVGLSAEEHLFVLRLQANEDAAYDELVRVYHGSIYQVARRMLADPAEASDVTQDIFVKVFRNIDRFKGESALKTWIFKIAFSEILNRIRWFKRRHRHATVSLDDAPGNGNSPMPVVQVKDESPRLMPSWNQRSARKRSSMRCGNCRSNTVRSSFCATSRAVPMARLPKFWESP